MGALISRSGLIYAKGDLHNVTERGPLCFSRLGRENPQKEGKAFERLGGNGGKEPQKKKGEKLLERKRCMGSILRPPVGDTRKRKAKRYSEKNRSIKVQSKKEVCTTFQWGKGYTGEAKGREQVGAEFFAAKKKR